MRKLALLLTLILVGGVVSNQTSYLFIPLIAASFYLSFRNWMPSFHWTSLALLTVMLSVYGAILGAAYGNALTYAAKFSTPLLVLFLFLNTTELHLFLYNNRKAINSAAFSFTLFVFIIILFELDTIAARSLQGWSIAFSSNSAIGLWHYFCLPFAGLTIYEVRRGNFQRYGRAHALMSLGTILMLWHITDTTAFKLACLCLAVILLAPAKSLIVAGKIFIACVSFLLIDYSGFQFVVATLVSMLKMNVTDAGDSVRVIQIDYFVRNFSLLGHGFGADHNFTFEDPNRMASAIKYPYASELPFLNLLHGAGLFAVAWIMGLLAGIWRLLTRLGRCQNDECSTLATYRIMCLLSLVGSISNPMLFSPVSMLLIGAAFAPTRARNALSSPSLGARKSDS